jgi:hypothetical protein
MILSNVNIGSGPSAGDGSPLRSAFTIINNNFQTIENNVNALTNSVNSVAGRTGNVILTVNDIVGLSSTYTSQANITAANVGMKGYVDAKITANIALLVNLAPTSLDTIRELADAIGDDPNFAVNVALSVSSANTKMRGYVDGQITAANAGVTAANVGIIGYINLANTIQSAQVGAANLAIVAANLGMKGYVDSVAGGSIYSNVNVKAYTETMGFQNFSNVNVAAYLTSQGVTGGSYSNVNAISLITSLGLSNYSNVNVKAYAESMGYQNFGNVNVAAYVTTANSAILGYIDLANTIQSGQVGAANLAIVAANLGMKGYVDSVASQSIYGNGNVLSYLTQFDGNIVPSANVTYSLGSITNQWKDLFVSNNTIYLGGVPVSISGGNLTVNGNAVGGTNLATYSGNVGASSITLDGATGPIGNVKVLNGGNGFTMFGFFAGSGGSGSGLSVVPQGSSLFDPVQINTRGTNYRVGDVITIVNTNEGNGYSNASIVVTSLQNQPAPSIFVGNSAYKFGADGNLTLPAGGDILDSTGASVLGSGGIPLAGATYNLNATAGLAINTTDGGIDFLRNGVTGIGIRAEGLHIYAANSYILWDGSVLKFPSGSDIQRDDGNGNFVSVLGGGSSYGNANVETYLPTYSGVVTASNVAVNGNVTAQYLFGNGSQLTGIVGGGSNYGNANVTAYTESMGFTNFSNVNVSALITTNGLTNYSNVNAKAYTETMGYQNFGNVNVAAYVTTANSAVIGYVDNAVLTANVGMKGYVDAGVIWSISASGTSDYVFSGPGIVAGNTNDPVLYLYKGLTYTFINTTGGSHPFAIRVSNGGADYTSGVSGSQTGTQTFTVPMDAPSTLYYQCTIHGGMGNTIYIGSIDNNYSNVNVKAYSESMGYQNYGNVNVAALITTNGLTNYSNVNVIAYLAGNVSAGNVFASGTSGKLGYTNGGFVQQITANSNGVSLNTVTGNIQLMGINLGVNGIHTVSFTNNKLEETDLILVSHHSGGVSNFAVGAYYAAPSTAIIWIRNITGADTSTLTPMLKFALIKAPGS